MAVATRFEVVQLDAGPFYKSHEVWPIMGVWGHTPRENLEFQVS